MIQPCHTAFCAGIDWGSEADQACVLDAARTERLPARRRGPCDVRGLADAARTDAHCLRSLPLRTPVRPSAIAKLAKKHRLQRPVDSVVTTPRTDTVILGPASVGAATARVRLLA